MQITHDSNNVLAPYTVWLYHPDRFAPHINVYLKGIHLLTGEPVSIKEIDINGLRIGPDLAERYAQALLEAVRFARANGRELVVEPQSQESISCL